MRVILVAALAPFPSFRRSLLNSMEQRQDVRMDRNPAVAEVPRHLAKPTHSNHETEKADPSPRT